ncbi:putative LRR receptor-like serine/threonine-protein kinase [Hordeum vulgare]|nr:putative LRR receptor-like serine/threonine-protein kinase [Hordeum vulgare]
MHAGFISIDCGISEQSSYMDDATELPYTSDAGFIDAGSNYNVSAEYTNSRGDRQALSLRSFPGPTGRRGCYTLPSFVAGTSKYLVRATFMYGNYDGLNKPPIFDLYLGINFWKTVNISRPDVVHVAEVIAVVPDDSVQVCLVNTGSGTPFISSLELRPLKDTLYPQANATQGLVLVGRHNFGAADLIRYPSDTYDRAWVPYTNPKDQWTTILTSSKVTMEVEDRKPLYEVPSVVMQTAVRPTNTTRNVMWFPWDAEPNHVYPMPGLLPVFYLAELETVDSKQERRMFLISLKRPNSSASWLIGDFDYLVTTVVSRTTGPVPFVSPKENLVILGAANATVLRPIMEINSTILPPFINAAELFTPISTAGVGTDAQDVSAITAIKAKYRLIKNWVGDPCAPKNLVWDGLNCSYPISRPQRITSVNMSFGGLSGDISSYFANLKAIQYLDLSHNNLTGSIPDGLSQLPSLVLLDLTGNELSGTIPFGLLIRIQDGNLTLRYDHSPNLCSNGSSCQPTKENRNSKTAGYIAVVIVAAVVVVGLVVLLLFFVIRRKQGPANIHNGESDVQSRNRRFTYTELKMITSNFRRVLGQGGFGLVYDGFLEDGTQVAVKLRSQSSNQGVKEFLTEAQNLTGIHHRNLVTLIGYCKDGDYMALVYEYMSKGDLQDKLRGRDHNDGCLTWRQRLHIVLESAQGLEYLHKACSPPFIHRDVKTSNILLDANLKAKVADFGLMKAFNQDGDTHVSTARVVGTPGYLAPEYATVLELTEKSDVYSFGVVLLEVITGKPPFVQIPQAQPIHIVKWVQQRLSSGDIEGVVDAHMKGDYDVNGVWKVADLALECMAQTPAKRPTMTRVIAQLLECLDLEESRSTIYTSVSGDTNGVVDTASASGDTSSGSSMYASDQPTSDVTQSSTTIGMGPTSSRASTVAAGPAAR